MMETSVSDAQVDAGGVDRTHIVLVGMMGSGKSSVGRGVSSRMGRPLLDSDQLIEESAGRSIPEIWEVDGEQAFRALETQVLLEALNSNEPAVIATGGGVVLSETNRAALVESDAHVVWLLADVGQLAARVSGSTQRPLLNSSEDSSVEAELSRILDDREPLYQEVADAVVSATNRSVSDVVKAVLRCCG